MANSHKDPYDYLNDLIVKRGKSGRYSVYATNVTVVVDSAAQYDYKVYSPQFDLFTAFPEAADEWLSMLVELRCRKGEDSYILTLNDRIYQFVSEGGLLSMNVFLPKLFVNHFKHEILHSQEMLRKVAWFQGSSPTTIRFNVGLVDKTWEELVEDGEVQEVDLTY